MNSRFFSAPSFLGLCSNNCSDPLTTEITSVYFFCIFLFCFSKTLLCNSLWKCLCTNFYFSLFLMCVFHKNPCSLFCFSFHRHTLISHGGVTFQASSECFCASTPQTNKQTNEQTNNELLKTEKSCTKTRPQNQISSLLLWGVWFQGQKAAEVHLLKISFFLIYNECRASKMQDVET